MVTTRDFPVAFDELTPHLLSLERITAAFFLDVTLLVWVFVLALNIPELLLLTVQQAVAWQRVFSILGELLFPTRRLPSPMPSSRSIWAALLLPIS